MCSPSFPPKRGRSRQNKTCGDPRRVCSPSASCSVRSRRVYLHSRRIYPHSRRVYPRSRRVYLHSRRVVPTHGLSACSCSPLFPPKLNTHSELGVHRLLCSPSFPLSLGLTPPTLIPRTRHSFQSRSAPKRKLPESKQERDTGVQERDAGETPCLAGVIAGTLFTRKHPGRHAVYTQAWQHHLASSRL